MSIIKSDVCASHPIDGVQVYLWLLKETLDDLCGLLVDATVLTNEPYISFKSEKRKREWVAVRVLLGKVLEQPFSIGYQTNGKPFLESGSMELSISHTKDVVGVALAKEPVGIDVEQIGSRPLLLKKHFVHPEDFDPESVDFAELMATFMWSAKESVYKLFSVPGLELLADIRLFPLVVGTAYTEFRAALPRLNKSAVVRCYCHSSFVLTVASFS